MRNLILVIDRGTSNWIYKNKQFLKKAQNYRKSFRIHEKMQSSTDQNIRKYLSNNSKESIVKEIADQSSYDKELKSFIDEFNLKHKNKMTLLDFSNYKTDFNTFRNSPIQKSDMDLLKQFQKRKIDNRIHDLQKINDSKGVEQEQEYDKNKEEWKRENRKEQFQEKDLQFSTETTNIAPDFICKQGQFHIQDNFLLYLIYSKFTSKSNKKGRTNKIKSLVFMGNGNGIISYGKGSHESKPQSIFAAVEDCKRNVIAIPRDPKCTLPLPLKGRFQDYRLNLKPIPSFNGWGHPIMTSFLSAGGIDHCRFNADHSSRNPYNPLGAYFKLITKNTTPKELAQEKGFKVYRHKFVRPLTDDAEIQKLV